MLLRSGTPVNLKPVASGLLSQVLAQEQRSGDGLAVLSAVGSVSGPREATPTQEQRQQQ